MNNIGGNNGFRQAIAVSTVLGVLFSSIVFQSLHARAQSSDQIVDFGLEAVGLGEDSAYAQRCSALFDVFTTNKEVWKNRASEFAKDIINEVTDNLVDFGPCGAAGQAARQAAGAIAGTIAGALGGPVLGNLVGGLFGGDDNPTCTIETTKSSPDAEDEAERDLIYDLMTRCMATAMIEDVQNDAALIAQTGAPDGGPTWVQDWGDVVPDAAHVGYLKAVNDLSNVDWCPTIERQITTLLNLDTENARPLNGRRDSLGLSIDQDLSCNNPPDADPSDLEGDPYWIYQMSLPQNNLALAYITASNYIEARIAKEVQDKRDELQANDGFTGVSGASPEESCVDRDPVTQKCLETDTRKVPGILVKENLVSANEAVLTQIANSDEMGELMADARPRITSLMQDLTASILNLDFEADLATRRYQDSDPGDPETNRANSNPDCGQPSATQCNCHTDPSAPTYSTAQSIAQSTVAAGVGATVLRNPSLFDANGRLIPGNEQTFIARICNNLGGGQSGCRSVPNQSPPPSHLLVFNSGAVEYAVSVLSASGVPLSQSPNAVYSCRIGVLP